MTCLSVCEAEGVRVVANPVFPLDDMTGPPIGANYRFEVLEADAAGLLLIIGQYRCFFIDDTIVWGKLVTLQPAMSVHPALAQLRHKAVMSGTLAIVPGLTGKTPA